MLNKQTKTTIAKPARRSGTGNSIPETTLGLQKVNQTLSRVLLDTSWASKQCLKCKSAQTLPLHPRLQLPQGHRKAGLLGAGSGFQSDEASGAEFRDLAGRRQRISMYRIHFAPFQGYQSPLIKAQRTLLCARLSHTDHQDEEGQLRLKRFILPLTKKSSAQTESQTSLDNLSSQTRDILGP